MNTPRANFLIRFFPSLTDAAFIMPLVFLYGVLDGTKRLLGDGDTGYHIRAGEWILQNGRVPDKDIFSFTNPDAAWFAWEWLWDVIFAWLHQHWGMAAVVLVSALLIAATFTLLFRITRERCGNDFIAIAVTWSAAAGSAFHWYARPHLFTLLFVLVFYLLLERIREGRRRLVFILPFLMLLWTNLHGGFLAGLILLACYAAGELARAAFETPQSRPAALAQARLYGLAGLACLAITFINPYGYKLHQHILHFFTESFHFTNVSEFMSLSFHHPLTRFFEIAIVLGAVSSYVSLRRKEFVFPLLYGIWLHGALFSARNIPIFLILTAPRMAADLAGALRLGSQLPAPAWLRRAANALQGAAAEFSIMDRLPRFYLPSATATVLLAVILYAPNPPSPFRAEYDPKRYPERALQFLRTAQIRHVFADDEWGDYLIYRLYPERKVFVDGRSDFYGGKFDRSYLDILDLKSGWQDTLRRYNVDTVLLRVDSPLAGALRDSRDWQTVYSDDVSTVFSSSAAKRAGDAKGSIVLSSNGHLRGRAATR